jgi:predicted O-linked N-acetylglucosamine transferase (SPINDLY family)
MAGPSPPQEAAPALQQLLGRATELHQRGQLPAAAELYLQVLRQKRDCFDALYRLGVLRIQQGRYDDAFEQLREALQAKPDAIEALSNFGVLLHMRNRHQEALVNFDRALSLRPAYADAHSNRGKVLDDLGRYEEALASYDRALSASPNHAEVLNNRGLALHHLQRYAQALASYDQALAVKPHFAKALNNRGTVLAELGRFDEALASYVKALMERPDYAEAHFNRGNVLAKLDRYEDALRSFDKAVAAKPDYAAAFDNRGSVLVKLRRQAEALASHDQALTLVPDSVGALTNRGNALKDLKRYEEALASYDAALAIDPDLPDTLFNRANLLKEMQRYDRALACYDKARAIKPDHADAFGWVDAALHTCDWRRMEGLVDALTAEIRQEKPTVTPFTLLGINDEPALHLQCARNYFHEVMPVRPEPIWKGESYRHDRIRVAYLSADLQEHATAFLIAELIELHDRSRFEILAISYGRDDGSDMRRRLVKAFDQFHDVREQSDREVAQLIKGLEVDILVDLKGYTKDARPAILGFRPAPIQVHYLGYPGTMGTDCIDYVIADGVVLPFEQQPHYAERIVQLPDCYQPNDSKRRIADPTLTRSQAGLPDDEFVFCSFNSNYKITPALFDVWMRLLDKVPGSVLWLQQGNTRAEANLRAEAHARGISEQRLVFGERMRLDAHLARHRLADLFLDTLPYNAHTTASDALWAGLPVLTCPGTAFAGRVAASLLRSIGLPELIAHSLADYEAAALHLAEDSARLDALRARLEQNRKTFPLFDADRHRRHIEAAYATMCKFRQEGAPQSFAVDPIGATDR